MDVSIELVKITMDLVKITMDLVKITTKFWYILLSQQLDLPIK